MKCPMRKKKCLVDVVGMDNWFYSQTVKEHFFRPRNFLANAGEAEKMGFNGVGLEGSPACGDLMKVWIRVDPKTERIKDFKWQTFGCCSAIASTSMLSVMVREKGGMKIDAALRITPQDIIKRLGGLPSRKIHCSVLGDKALKAAINDYFRKSGQQERAAEKGIRVIDKILKITDRDIEQAVLQGARNFEEVQHMTKAGIRDKNCIPEVKELIRFYRKKHFGARE